MTKPKKSLSKKSSKQKEALKRAQEARRRSNPIERRAVKEEIPKIKKKMRECEAEFEDSGIYDKEERYFVVRSKYKYIFDT